MKIQEQKNTKQKNRRNIFLTTGIGLVLGILGSVFFYFYLQELLAGDYINSLGTMGIGLVLICAGLLICLIPNSIRASRRGIEQSMKIYKEVMEQTGMINAMLPPGVTPGRIRLCVECGRNIPFDANLCPYCGHQYS